MGVLSVLYGCRAAGETEPTGGRDRQVRGVCAPNIKQSEEELDEGGYFTHKFNIRRPDRPSSCAHWLGLPAEPRTPELSRWHGQTEETTVRGGGRNGT